MTLRTNRIDKADGSIGIDTDNLVNGSATAFGAFGMDPNLLSDSLNVASMVDGGTGVASFNFTNIYADLGYAVTGGGRGWHNIARPNTASQLSHTSGQSAHANYDFNNNSFAVYGGPL